MDTQTNQQNKANNISIFVVVVLLSVVIGVDLVLLSAKQQISHAVVIAGDNDLIRALAVAKNEGVLIHLYHGSAPHRKLLEVADERTRITTEFLSDVLYTG